MARSLTRCVSTAALFALTGGGCGGCGDDDPSPPVGAKSLRVPIPLPADTKLLVVAGVPLETRRTIKIPGDLALGDVASIALDMGATLPDIEIKRADGGTSTVAPAVTFRIGIAPGAQPNMPCPDAPGAQTTITGNADFTTKTAAPLQSSLPSAAIDNLNSREFGLCMRIDSTVDVNVSLGGMVVAYDFAEDCDTTGNLAGRWVGPYTCTNVGSSSETGTVSLSVLQAGDTAFYWDDGGAIYFGSVCGDTFYHVGGGGTYTETGRLTRTGPTTATKESSWVSTYDLGQHGVCTDHLKLQP